MLNDWHALGSVQYRKWHVYDMAWGKDLALENFLVSGAPFGGPLALFPDVKRLMAQNNGQEPSNMKLQIFTSAGILLSEFDWTDRPIIAMGWTQSETLVTVTDQGWVRIYTLYCKVVLEFQLLSMSDIGPIVECHFWSNGLAAMTSNNIIKVAEGLSSSDIEASMPKIYKLDCKLNKSDSFTAMALINPVVSKSGYLEVMVGTTGMTILTLYESEDGQQHLEDQFLVQKLNSSHPLKISLSPDGSHVAIYRRDGVLTVLHANFTAKVVDFDTRSSSKPLCVEWCGKDAVVMRWANTGVVMVGPFGDWLNFPPDSTGLCVVPEPDCCRIVSNKTCSILQMVSPHTQSALELGSTDPAALILDAMEAFEEGDAKSDENIRIIAAANQLADAVHTCILAASQEFEPAQQQRLLKAASYGKAFGPDIDATAFVETSKRLRVLNMVRQPSIGLPLTITQFLTLSAEVLVGRLTSRNEHYLALKISELLKLRTEQVLIHWAKCKVRQMVVRGEGEESIFHTVLSMMERYARGEKVGMVGGLGVGESKNDKRGAAGPVGSKQPLKISYLSIAEAAYEMGRTKLAVKFLNAEPSLSDQIPLLLRMGEEEGALAKAVVCGDANLLYFTVITLEDRLVGMYDGMGAQEEYGMRGASTAGRNTSQSTAPGGNVSRSTLERFFRLLSAYPEAVNLLKIYYTYKPTPTKVTLSLGSGGGGLGGVPLHPLLQLYVYYRQYIDGCMFILSSYLGPLRGAGSGDQGGLGLALGVGGGEDMKVYKDCLSILNPPQTATPHPPSLAAPSKDTLANIALYKSILEETAELLVYQQSLSLRFHAPRNFLHQSLAETIQSLMVLALESKEDKLTAEGELIKLIKKFKVSEKMLGYIKIGVYGSKGDWAGLTRWGLEKKPAMGYKPLAIMLISNNRPESEVSVFIEKLSNNEDKFELYMDCKSYAKAAEVATKMKDPERLSEVARLCRDVNLERSIQDVISRM